MKAIKRKLLSLLLAMAMVCSLAPTALAATEFSGSLRADPSTIAVGESTTITLTYTLPDTTTFYDAEWTVDGSPTGVTLTPAADKKSATLSVASTFTGTSVTVSCDVSFQWPEGGAGIDTEHTVETNITVTQPQTPVATKIGLPTASTATVSIAANADSTTATAYVLDQNGEQMNGAIKVERTSGATATASVNGNTINIQREGTAAGDTVFTVSAANDTTVQTATLTVSVTAKAVALPTFTITANPTSIAADGQSNLTIPSTTSTGAVMPSYNGVTWEITNGSTLARLNSLTTTTGSNILVGNNVATGGSVTVKATLTQAGTAVAEGTVNVSVANANTFQIQITANSGYTNNYNTSTSTFNSVGAYATASFINGPDNLTGYTISWTVSPSNSNVISLQNNYGNNPQITIVSNASGSVNLTVTLSGSGLQTYTATKTIYVNYQYQLNPTVTVYRGENYNLSDTDVNNTRSIIQQITNGISGLYSYPYVMFSDNSVTGGSLTARLNYPYFLTSVPTGYNGGLLSDIDFVPSTSNSATKAEFRFTLYYYNGVNGSSTNTYTGLMTFNITGEASTGDITYTASIGDDVSFNLKDFEDFYYSKTKGTLSYVSFTLPSGGSLYSDRGRLTTSNACYASPTGTQADLGGVYFTPSGTTATRANTVRISFTAYGSRYTNGTSGTVVITYLAGTAKDITYNISTSGTLKASDFTDAYKAVVGSTAPTGLTIQFQTVPTYGTLTYKDSSRTNSSTVTLRSSNIKSYNFTTRSTGSNQLADVTYTASGTRSDTIEYIAYVNSTPQFTGKVVFNSSNASASNMQVSFTSTGGQSVAFSYNAFVTANAAAMASTSYIRFVTMPTGGTLTYNGAAMSLTSTNVLPALLGSVVYRPNTGYNNSTDRISFVCYDANGNSVGGGQVSIIVTGNTSGSSGANTVNQFKDVTATAWYRNDLITLVNAGIIQGRGDGKFDPTAELTYGEALKIFMLASGYPAQAEASGKDWAINYKNLAVSNGWISSDIDLSAKISRNAMAELAAKSLGVSPSSSVPPTWKDGTSNSYANALYYTSPQILIGNADGTFKGTSTLLRQEICAIASRVLSYKANQQSMEKPGWIG